MSKWLRKVNIGQEVIHCPNCGSGHVKKSPSAMLILGIPIIILISILPSVGMREVLVLVLGLVLAGIELLDRLTIKAILIYMKCQECHHSFIVSSETFRAYKKALKHKQ